MTCPTSGYKIVHVDPLTGELFTQRAFNRTVWKIGQESRHESPEPIAPCERGLHFSDSPLDTYNYFSVIVPDQLEQPKLALHRVIVPVDRGATVLPCQEDTEQKAYRKFVADRLILEGPVTGILIIDPTIKSANQIVPSLFLSLDSDGLLHSSRSADDEREHLREKNCHHDKTLKEWVMPSYVVRTKNNRSRFFVHGRLALSIPSLTLNENLIDPSAFRRTCLKIDDTPILLLARSQYERLLKLFTDPERMILADLVHFSAIASESKRSATELFKGWVDRYWSEMAVLRLSSSSRGPEEFIRALYVHMARPLGSLEPLRAFRALLPHCRDWTEGKKCGTVSDGC